jgi:carboxyl-terminal processing protease
VRAAASGARSVEELAPALRTALTLLGDGHSSFVLPSGRVLFVPLRPCSAAMVADPTVPSTIGYVRVPTFSGTIAQAGTLASTLQSGIRARDVPGVVGWIVDLRGNSGGNMWPMIAGVGPILGEGVIGYFIDPSGSATVWEYRAGAARLSGSELQRVAMPYVLREGAPPVAVLIDNLVASSGEAVAIAFKGRANTRFFGSATCGVSTSNQTFSFADGSLFNLTVATMADRNRVLFGEQVQPDERIVAADSVVSRALEWLRTGR